MTLKQLAERMGLSPQQFDFELEMPCKACKTMGGTEEPCEGCCEIKARIEIKVVEG